MLHKNIEGRTASVHMRFDCTFPGRCDKLGDMSLTPDVRLDGELVVGQTLRRRPLNGELGPGMSCVGVASHKPAEAKVCHFDQVVLADQAVTGSQVPAEVRENKSKMCEKVI